MTLSRRSLLAGLAIPAVRSVRTQDRPLRIGVLTALSGAYQDGAGEGSVLAARMAVEDAGVAADILAGDMLDKPDVGLSVARAWFDRDGVDAIVDVPNSAIALAVAGLVRERNKLALFTGPGIAALSGAACSPNHLQWTYDTRALARTTGRAVLQAGGRRWFFITADYAFGHALQADTTREIVAGGGQVVGSAAFPFPETTDFAAFLLQAQASGADVIGLACTGAHLNTVVKQAAEFRLGLRLAALICLVTSVHAIGLADAQGMMLSLPFYWDLTPATRAFARRFAARYGGVMPSMTQAGTYTAVLHYLRSAGGVRDGTAAVARMKARPVTDGLFTGTVIRPTGSVMHDMHLFTVKTPAEQRYQWDYLRDDRMIPAAQAFGPAQAACAGF